MEMGGTAAEGMDGTVMEGMDGAISRALLPKGVPRMGGGEPSVGRRGVGDRLHPSFTRPPVRRGASRGRALGGGRRGGPSLPPPPPAPPPPPTGAPGPRCPYPPPRKTIGK